MTVTTGESVLHRVLKVIYAVAGSGPAGIGVSALARQIDMSKAVAHRLLTGLVAEGFLTVNPETKCYRLGSGALSVGLAALNQIDVVRISRPYLERLVEHTAETATLSTRQGWRRLYVDQVLSPQEIRMSVTTQVPYPLHAGASSKAVLAALADEQIEEYLNGQTLEPITGSTISTREALLAEIALIRERGYAWSVGERDSGAGSVAAPLLGPHGEVVGSISICGPLHRIQKADVTALGGLVKQAAREASDALMTHSRPLPTKP